MHVANRGWLDPKVLYIPMAYGYLIDNCEVLCKSASQSFSVIFDVLQNQVGISFMWNKEQGGVYQ